MATDTPDLATGPFSAPDHVVFTDLDGTEGVLVDLNTRQYFQLNATACAIWRGLSQRITAAEVARRLAAEYDVTPEHARASVDAAIRTFLAHRLLTGARVAGGQA